MNSKANTHKAGFRPHFKTHQSLEIGSGFKETGIKKITVSSFTMAYYLMIILVHSCMTGNLMKFTLLLMN